MATIAENSKVIIIDKPVNPLIDCIPRAYPEAEYLIKGGDSILYRLPGDIAVKVGFEKEYEDADKSQLPKEQAIFEQLEDDDRKNGCGPCPFLVQCFYRGPDMTFLEFLPCGMLSDHVRRPDRPVASWMLQLATAVARLAMLGYAHGDLCPRNVLVDDYDQIRLIDLGFAVRYGEAVDVGREPYVRQGRRSAPHAPSHRCSGTYGTAGPGTEQFALGSLFWYMWRGTEVYDEIDTVARVDLLCAGKYPSLGDPVSVEPIGAILGRCWREEYATIASLVEDIQTRLPAAELHWDDALRRRQQRQSKRALCEEYYKVIHAEAEK